MENKTPIWQTILGIIFIVAFAFLISSTKNKNSQNVQKMSQTFHYSCDADKTLTADLLLQGVVINLDDGRSFTLEQTRSASGVRYANEGEKFVFWTKGMTAFVEEDGKTTYENCVTKDLPQT